MNIRVGLAIPVSLREALIKDLLQLLHNIISMYGDQTAIFMERLIQNAYKIKNIFMNFPNNMMFIELYKKNHMYTHKTQKHTHIYTKTLHIPITRIK